MPAISPTGQPGPANDWFLTDAGQAVLHSEAPLVTEFLGGRQGRPWLWLAPAPPETAVAGRGLCLVHRNGRFSGPVTCAMPLPLPSATFGAVVLQHVLDGRDDGVRLLEEAARVLAPGGDLCALVLNPLTPYRWHWRGAGVASAEPLGWRRRMREVGLAPDAVSSGVGPVWRPAISATAQNGAGMRAAYALRAQKRHLPLTPVRPRRAIALPAALPSS